MLVPIGLAALSWATPAVAAAGLQDIAGIERRCRLYRSVDRCAGARRVRSTGGCGCRLRRALALSWRGESHASILVECPDPGSWHILSRRRAVAVPIHPQRR
jgi:flagella basal body P-ring formation protein FlgA